MLNPSGFFYQNITTHTYIYIYICICALIIYTKNHYAIKRFMHLYLLDYPSHLYFVGGEEIVFYKKADNNIEKAIDSSI